MKNTTTFLKVLLIVLICVAGIVSVTAQTSPSWKFIIYGDTRSDDSAHRSVLSSIMTNTPDYKFIINVGDVVDVGTSTSQWNTWQRACNDILGGLGQTSVPPKYMAVPGNHDATETSTGLNNWNNYLPGQVQQFGNQGKFFTFDYENARFIIMDSDYSSLTGAQLTMMNNAINNLPSHIKWLFTVWHHPIFDFGPKSYQSSIHQYWGKPLYEAGTDIMFMGHAHYYVRSKKLRLDGTKNPPVEAEAYKGTAQIVTGNGAAPLYSYNLDKDNNRYMVESAAAEYGYTEFVVEGETMYMRHILSNGTVADQETYIANRKGPIVVTPTPTATPTATPTVGPTEIPATATPTATPTIGVTPTPILVNIAAGKPIYTSSDFSGDFPAVNANDGNDTTIWGSGTVNKTEWIYVDLLKKEKFCGIGLDWFDIYYAGRYSVYISDDAKTWTKVITLTKTTPGADKLVSDGEVAARYVAVLFETKKEVAVALSEYKVFQRVIPIPTTPTPTATPTPSPTIEPTTTPTPTPPIGGCTDWAYPVVYNVGDCVSYKGIEYICGMAHTSNAAWTPDTTATLWQPK